MFTNRVQREEEKKKKRIETDMHLITKIYIPLSESVVSLNTKELNP